MTQERSPGSPLGCVHLQDFHFFADRQQIRENLIII